MKKSTPPTEAQALPRIAAYCSKAERAEYDVVKKLTTWGLDDDATQRIVKRLKQENFLSDSRFCESFIKDKMRFNKWGRNKIIFELKKKRIAESLISQTFEDLENDEFEENLLRLLSNKQKSVKGKDDYDKRNKLIRFGLGRGYTMDQVLACINKLVNTVDEDF